MAFHIDIVRIVGAQGPDVLSCEYTIDDCIKNGWMSTAGIWLRKEIDLWACCSSGQHPIGAARIPDSKYGQDQKLKLVQRNGKWVADMGDGLFFK